MNLLELPSSGEKDQRRADYSQRARIQDHGTRGNVFKFDYNGRNLERALNAGVRQQERDQALRDFHDTDAPESSFFFHVTDDYEEAAHIPRANSDEIPEYIRPDATLLYTDGRALLSAEDYSDDDTDFEALMEESPLTVLVDPLEAFGRARHPKQSPSLRWHADAGRLAEGYQNPDNDPSDFIDGFHIIQSR